MASASMLNRACPALRCIAKSIIVDTYSSVMVKNPKTTVQIVLGAAFLDKAGSKIINQLINCEYQLIARL
jgi:hypothetical protein